jgi:hypothetical protein
MTYSCKLTGHRADIGASAVAEQPAGAGAATGEATS